MLRSKVEYSGPIFQSDVDSTVGRHLNAAQEEVGSHLVNRVRAVLDNVLVNPTGHYRSRIAYTVFEDSTLITDRGVVYGAWLEGVSSKNSTSRFKGYAHFRRVTQKTEAEIPQIVQGEVDQMVKELS